MEKVEFEKSAYRSLDKLPGYIVSKLKTWVAQVELIGLSEVRKRSGFHDEPFKGERKGQRSIRLNKDYRAMYVESCHEGTKILTVIEVTKHEY